MVREGIADRAIRYALDVIRLFREIEGDNVGRIVGRQLLRSATSIGANIHEAQGGQSRADFAAKMTIAHKEARESAFWIRILEESRLCPSTQFEKVRSETVEINKILAATILTLKRGPH